MAAALPKKRARLAERGQDLGKNFVRHHQGAAGQSPARLQGSLVPLVVAVKKGDPVKGVGENASHDAGRLGVP